MLDFAALAIGFSCFDVLASTDNAPGEAESEAARRLDDEPADARSAIALRGASAVLRFTGGAVRVAGPDVPRVVDPLGAGVVSGVGRLGSGRVPIDVDGFQDIDDDMGGS